MSKKGFPYKRVSPLLRTAKECESLKADKRVTLDFHLHGYRFSDEFIVIPSLSEKVIIGALTQEKWHMQLDFKNKEVIIDPEVTQLRLLLFHWGARGGTNCNSANVTCDNLI